MCTLLSSRITHCAVHAGCKGIKQTPTIQAAVTALPNSKLLRCDPLLQAVHCWCSLLWLLQDARWQPVLLNHHAHPQQPGGQSKSCPRALLHSNSSVITQRSDMLQGRLLTWHLTEEHHTCAKPNVDIHAALADARRPTPSKAATYPSCHIL
jgi:hypothetical protein